MTSILLIANTIMTAGILVGVLTTDTEMKEMVCKLNRFLKEKLEDLKDGK